MINFIKLYLKYIYKYNTNYMKIFPEKMKQHTRYILLIVGSLGIACYGISMNNNIFLRLIATLLFWVGLIGLVVELVKKMKNRKNK